MKLFPTSIILILVACCFAACDDGHPSPSVLSDTKQLRKYLERGGDPNGVTKKDSYKGQQTLLHRAAIYRDEEIVRMLLAAGGKPNHGDSSGWTPLMAVFTTRDQDPSRLGVIKCLLEVSDLTVKDESGKTAYDHAKEYGLADEIELVRKAMESRSRDEKKEP